MHEKENSVSKHSMNSFTTGIFGVSDSLSFDTHTRSKGFRITAEAHASKDGRLS